MEQWIWRNLTVATETPRRNNALLQLLKMRTTLNATDDVRSQSTLRKSLLPFVRTLKIELYHLKHLCESCRHIPRFLQECSDLRALEIYSEENFGSRAPWHFHPGTVFALGLMLPSSVTRLRLQGADLETPTDSEHMAGALGLSQMTALEIYGCTNVSPFVKAFCRQIRTGTTGLRLESVDIRLIVEAGENDFKAVAELLRTAKRLKRIVLDTGETNPLESTHFNLDCITRHGDALKTLLLRSVVEYDFQTNNSEDDELEDSEDNESEDDEFGGQPMFIGPWLRMEYLCRIIDACPQLEQLGTFLPMHPSYHAILRKNKVNKTLFPLAIIAWARNLHTLRIICDPGFEGQIPEKALETTLAGYAKELFQLFCSHGSQVKTITFTNYHDYFEDSSLLHSFSREDLFDGEPVRELNADELSSLVLSSHMLYRARIHHSMHMLAEEFNAGMVHGVSPNLL
ncbi:hypothetical protein K491DRAFT_687940 [Lophiostoma macrostomum CBS 122681]|uniref:Uncharacterized protein n=1 Tax=Lophiostoma macrostomum CBS 122681 TaxID=1314788 RepID=A0A6A6TPI5_9PLEO|nr:hypothetical protein K491DRAFT_687940 [Lophiostoma macrostomum CBS 122681]